MGNHRLQGRNVVRIKSWMMVIGESLKRLAKSNQRKTTGELRGVFNSESKSISTHTMWRELKGLGLNSCVALRKPLISKAKQKKGFSLLGSIKIGLWRTGRRSCGLMSPDWPCSRVMGASGWEEKLMEWLLIMLIAYSTSLRGQGYGIDSASLI